jgi:chemotaxis response regulator CheB
MTGMGSDGKSGVREIKENGGYVLAESRQSSEAFSMPEAAISTGMVDRVLSTREVGAWILRRPSVCRPELA